MCDMTKGMINMHDVSLNKYDIFLSDMKFVTYAQVLVVLLNQLHSVEWLVSTSMIISTWACV